MSTPKIRQGRKAVLPSKSTTGAIQTPSSVKEAVSGPGKGTAGANTTTAHQTHGGFTPLSGPITNVSQLVNGGRNVAKGSAGSFQSIGEYEAYLRTLSTADLHNHAVKDAHLVPIDDRERLIRRLTVAWTSTAALYPGRGNPAPIPPRAPFTPEQIEAQDKIRRELLKGR